VKIDHLLSIGILKTTQSSSIYLVLTNFHSLKKILIISINELIPRALSSNDLETRNTNSKT